MSCKPALLICRAMVHSPISFAHDALSLVCPPGRAQPVFGLPLNYVENRYV